jgi:hypothetical protein
MTLFRTQRTSLLKQGFAASLGLAAGLGLVSCVALPTEAQAEPTRTCQFDPELGLPNPLGMRAYITVSEEDGNTSFLFEQFPSNLNSPDVAATVASSRTVTFYETGLDEARQLMLENPEFYAELVGYPDEEGFALTNAVLVCTP